MKYAILPIALLEGIVYDGSIRNSNDGEFFIMRDDNTLGIVAPENTEWLSHEQILETILEDNWKEPVNPYGSK
jgi:hypothetical protein